MLRPPIKRLLLDRPDAATLSWLKAKEGGKQPSLCLTNTLASRFGEDRAYTPASAAVTTPRNESDERMTSISASTRRKNTSPPKKSHGHTHSGTASVSKRRCNGGA